MITISKEDYLKAILEAESEDEAVISATLAHWLKVSAPAVTMAVRRLKRDGLVRVDGDGRIRLTPEGREIANRLAVRHHLIERMLSEIFGMEWTKVHDEAERLEHAVSADFEMRLAEKIGRGGICPHGNRMNETPEARRKRGHILLSEAEAGRAYTVASVYERDRDLLFFLDKRALRPGARLRIVARNYDQTLTVDAGAGEITLGGPAAEKVWVAPLPRSRTTP